jgi:hypothetical protein
MVRIRGNKWDSATQPLMHQIENDFNLESNQSSFQTQPYLGDWKDTKSRYISYLFTDDNPFQGGGGIKGPFSNQRGQDSNVQTHMRLKGLGKRHQRPSRLRIDQNAVVPSVTSQVNHPFRQATSDFVEELPNQRSFKTQNLGLGPRDQPQRSIVVVAPLHEQFDLCKSMFPAFGDVEIWRMVGEMAMHYAARQIHLMEARLVDRYTHEDVEMHGI